MLPSLVAACAKKTADQAAAEAQAEEEGGSSSKPQVPVDPAAANKIARLLEENVDLKDENRKYEGILAELRSLPCENGRLLEQIGILTEEVAILKKEVGGKNENRPSKTTSKTKNGPKYKAKAVQSRLNIRPSRHLKTEWTPNDDAELTKLYTKRADFHIISKTMGRGYDLCQHRAQFLQLMMK